MFKYSNNLLFSKSENIFLFHYKVRIDFEDWLQAAPVVLLWLIRMKEPVENSKRKVRS